MSGLWWLGYLISALLGLVVGSFLNVAIYRHNTGRTLGGRSHCLTCNATLGVWDLIPIFSFIFLRGRCRHCSAKISLQYLLVEIITAVVFTLIYQAVGLEPITLVYYFIVSGLLIVIAGYDLKHKIIPNDLVYAFAGLGLASAVILNLNNWLMLEVVIRLVHNILSGLAFYYVIWGLWKVSGGKWIGLGDAKLMLGMGFLLGFFKGLSAILVGVWAGAIVGLLLIIVGRYQFKWLPASLRRFKLTAKSEIPFAPFLILGVLVSIITNFNVFPY